MLLFGSTLDHDNLDLTDTRGIVFMFRNARFERRKVPGLEEMGEAPVRNADWFAQTEHGGFVFGIFGIFGKLLLVGVADLRMRLHDNTGFGSVHTCFLGTFMAAGINLGCEFSKVPYIPRVILCEPIVCFFR